MSREAIEMDSDSEKSIQKKAETLQALATGPLASAVAKISGSSRGIPSEEDFHFFYNFGEFKGPIKEIAEKSESMLKSIGSSNYIWGKPLVFPDDSDEAYNWLVNINDEVFERFDVSVDEFQRLRKKEEERGSVISSMDSENGFQLVYGRKKKGNSRNTDKDEGENSSALGSVKTISRDKKTMGARPRVPFHIPTIPRPQDEYNILVNNSNQPFEHVWLQKSDDGSRFIHPLEKFSELDFVDRVIGDVEELKPLPIESTPFKLVEEVKELKELASKLRNLNEFAVDLEHNQYRSFQGMTCLMQISTRTEDFVIDTLKLRVHLGPYLREVFKDPSKKKVMHGADRDIVWLQRDFGIYVCNLFDTGQASRVMQLERNSLEYLLHHFCGVIANKEYQNADWRLRPIPDEMLKYAREDTHYLLHIYDLMKSRLLAASTGSENGDALLLEVYKRSYDICMQLYEKEILTDTSYLYIYGLQGADFNSEQLSVVAALCQWRDVVARAEDESTGYILPNKALLEIARQMPLTTGKLRRLVKSKHSYVERNLGSVVSIIRSSIQNASAFEDAAEQLKKGRLETAPEHNMVVADESERLPSPEGSTDLETVSAQPGKVDSENGNRVKRKMAEFVAASVHVKEVPLDIGCSAVENGRRGQKSFFELSGEAGEIKNVPDSCPLEIPKESFTISGQMGGTKAITGATVEVLKKPSRAFGALLGNSASKRKLGLDPKVEMKVEQIKSSVILPFHSFSGRNEQLKPPKVESTKATLTEESVAPPAEATKLEEVMSLESDLNDQESVDDAPTADNDGLDLRENNSTFESDLGAGDEPMSLSELSNSFQKCFQSMNDKRNTIRTDGSQELNGLQLKPFDYEAARKQMRFGENEEGEKGDEGLKSLLNSKERRKTSVSRVPRDEGVKDFQPARRRQAFPHTGNRSATFR